MQTGLNELEHPTPLASIRIFSEILLDDPKTELAQHKNFLGIITKETGRLSDAMLCCDRDHGRVRTGVTERDAWLQVEACDNGPGAGRSGGISIFAPARGGNP